MLKIKTLVAGVLATAFNSAAANLYAWLLSVAKGAAVGDTNRIRKATLAILILAGALTSGPVNSATIFELATNGCTAGGTACPGGSVVSSTQFIGAGFSLTQSFQITGLGANLVDSNPVSGGLWVAIVTLSGPGAVPSFLPSTIFSHALGYAELYPITPYPLPVGPNSGDVTGSLASSLVLGPGDYAVILGSQNGFYPSLSNAYGDAAATEWNPALPGVSLFLGLVTPGLWIPDNPSVGDPTFRLFVEGEPVGAAPLPTALPLFASGLGGLGLLAWRRKRKNAARAAA